MKRYMWFFDFYQMLVTMAIALIGGYVFTYLLSCAIRACGSYAFIREVGPFFVLVFGGLTVYGHITSLTRPTSGVVSTAVVDSELAEYTEDAIKTGHEDFISLISTVVGAILAFVVSLVISIFIL